jgi:Fe-S cluster biogenesis protein NfuA
MAAVLTNSAHETRRTEMQDKAIQVLEHFKPFFHAHGGDFEVKEVTDDGRVKIHMTGECVLCALKEKTASGMEQALKNAVPGITGVDVV